CRKGLNGAPVLLEHTLHRVANAAVVVDDEDDGLLGPASRRGGAWSGRGSGRLRARAQALAGLRQFLDRHRLVQLHAVLERNIPQRGGRYIAGQNDDRSLAIEVLPHLCGKLEPIQPSWEIVVRQDDVRSNRASRDHLQGRGAVWRRHNPVAFVVEEKLKSLADLRVIFDDKDSAAMPMFFPGRRASVVAMR